MPSLPQRCGRWQACDPTPGSTPACHPAPIEGRLGGLVERAVDAGARTLSGAHLRRVAPVARCGRRTTRRAPGRRLHGAPRRPLRGTCKGLRCRKRQAATPGVTGETMTYQAPVDDILHALKTAAGLDELMLTGLLDGVDE